jgi:hypothetical protein
MSKAETGQSPTVATAAAEPTSSTRPRAERDHTAPVVEGSGSQSSAPGPSGPCGPAPNLERATEGNRRLTARSECGDGDGDGERMCTCNVWSCPKSEAKSVRSGPALIRRPHLALLTSLSILDRLLALLVLIAMILGVVIGVYAPNVQEIFNKEAFAGTSIRT